MGVASGHGQAGANRGNSPTVRRVFWLGVTHEPTVDIRIGLGQQRNELMPAGFIELFQRMLKIRLQYDIQFQHAAPTLKPQSSLLRVR